MWHFQKQQVEYIMDFIGLSLLYNKLLESIVKTCNAITPNSWDSVFGNEVSSILRTFEKLGEKLRIRSWQTSLRTLNQINYITVIFKLKFIVKKLRLSSTIYFVYFYKTWHIETTIQQHHFYVRNQTVFNIFKCMEFKNIFKIIRFFFHCSRCNQ